MINYVKEHLKEKTLLFLYILSSVEKKVSYNTFKRYLYLFYLSESFFDKKSDSISLSIENGNLKIPYLDSILDDMQLSDLITLEENGIVIEEYLIEYVNDMLKEREGKNGECYDLYRKLKPFLNLLISYDDQFIFRIFFSEPTYKEALERGLIDYNSTSSKLTELLNKFKANIANENIDDFDILTFWMDFVLKNYYMGESKDE